MCRRPLEFKTEPLWRLHPHAVIILATIIITLEHSASSHFSHSSVRFNTHPIKPLFSHSPLSFSVAMSHSEHQQLLQQLVEVFTCETSSNHPVDGSISTSSLSLILSSLTASTLDQLDCHALPSSTSALLHSQLRCIPPSTYHQLLSTLTALTSLPSTSLTSPPWTFLSQHAISARPLVALLSLQLHSLTPTSLTLCSIYFTLLCLPNAPLHLWNEEVATKAFTLIARWSTLHSPHSGPQQPRKKTRQAAQPAEEAEEEAEEEEEGQAMEVQGVADDSPGEVSEHDMQGVLRCLLAALAAFSLLPYPDVKPALLDSLIALTRTQRDADAATAAVVSLAWAALRANCEALHGEPHHSWAMLLKALLPSASMTFTPSPSPTPPPHLRLIANSTLTFALSSPTTLLLPFLQHLTLAAPDRSEYRHLLTHLLTTAIQARPELLGAFARFLSRLARNAKVGVRMMAVEVAAELVRMWTEGEITVLTDAVALLMGRCSDRAPGVRTRALMEVGRLLEGKADGSDEVRRAIVALLEDDEALELSAGRSSLVLATPHRRQSVFERATPLELYTPSVSAASSAMLMTPATPTMPSVGWQSLLHLLHRRCADPKPTVRKAALASLTSALVGGQLASLSVESLQSLYDGCQDQSLLVRKAAMASLTSVAAAYPTDAVVGKVWLGAVLPLVDDAESTVRDRAVQCVREVLVDRVERAMGGGEGGEVWALLASLDEGMVHLLHLAVGRLLQAGGVGEELLRALNDAATTSDEVGVWLMLDAISRQQPSAVDVRRLLQAWERVEGSSDGLFLLLLSVIGQVATSLRDADAHRLITRLRTRVSSLHQPMSAAVIKAAISTIAILHSAHQSSQHEGWEEQLLRDGELTLEQLVLRGQPLHAEREEEVLRSLFTVGEVGLRGVVKVSTTLLSCVQSLTAPTLSLTSPPSPSHPALPLGGSVRACAFLALGKLALRDAVLAKRSLPLFIRALTSAASPVVLRNNLLILLSDLCRTFTALVDPHLAALTSTLSDPSPLLRRHALLVLTQLLQEDYLKMKPALLLPLLSTLADADPDVATLAHSALTHLLSQAGSKAQHVFIDVLFYLNASPSTSLPGPPPNPLPTPKRRVVYDFLLSHLQDEAKLLTSAKLCQDVLGSVVDGRLSLDSAGVGTVVADALAVLASPAMRLSPRPSPSDDAGEDADEPAAAPPADERLKAAKGRLLSQLAKRSALESIIPVVMELKRVLERRKSGLVAGVMEYLRVVYGEFKGEVMGILEGDRQLAVEFEFDMKRLDDEKKERERRRSSVGAKRTSAGRKAAASADVIPEAREEVELTLQNVAAAVLSSPVASSAVVGSPLSAVKMSGSFETPSKAAAGARTAPSSAVFMSPRLKTTSGSGTTPQSGITQSSNRRVSSSPVALFPAVHLPPAALSHLSCGGVHVNSHHCGECLPSPCFNQRPDARRARSRPPPRRRLHPLPLCGWRPRRRTSGR